MTATPALTATPPYVRDGMRPLRRLHGNGITGVDAGLFRRWRLELTDPPLLAVQPAAWLRPRGTPSMLLRLRR